MAVVTMRQLLEAGVHFGHQTRRWNPKMKRFIFGERNGIYIIDLNQTLQRVDVAYSFVRDLVANGGSVLFIGTKKQSQDPISRFAQQCGMPFVNERWLGGMLTNYTTIAARVKKMQEYERMRASGDFEAMPKKEALILSRELEKLQRNLGGIRDMVRLPEAVFIIDIKKEHIGVSEANKMGIPIVAVVDTNCDPDVVQYPIPGNDDAIRSGSLMCRVMADAVQEGRFVASRRGAFALAAAAHAVPVPPLGPPPRAHVPTPVAPVAPSAAPIRDAPPRPAAAPAQTAPPSPPPGASPPPVPAAPPSPTPATPPSPTPATPPSPTPATLQAETAASEVAEAAASSATAASSLTAASSPEPAPVAETASPVGAAAPDGGVETSPTTENES
jgi:small subunit ribosomal protein S2